MVGRLGSWTVVGMSIHYPGHAGRQVERGSRGFAPVLKDLAVGGALGTNGSRSGYRGVLTSFFFLTPSHTSYPALLSTLLHVLSCLVPHTLLPHDLSLRYGLGVCFLRSGRLQFAKMHLEKAVEVHPRNAIILKSLGEVSCLCRPFPPMEPQKGMLDCCGITSIRVLSTSRTVLQNNFLDIPVVCTLSTRILTRTRAIPGLRTPQRPELCARAVRSDTGAPAQFGDVSVQTSQAVPHTGEIPGACVLRCPLLSSVLYLAMPLTETLWNF